MPRHAVQPPEWIDSAPIQVTRTIEIDAPPSEVWRHITDHAAWPQWFTELDRVEPLGAPTGVGGGRRVIVKRLPLDEEFTAWDEDRHFAFAVVRTKLPILATMAESVRLEPTGSRTGVVYRQGLAGRPGFGWAMNLVWRRAGGQLERALANLKLRVEAAEG